VNIDDNYFLTFY